MNILDLAVGDGTNSETFILYSTLHCVVASQTATLLKDDKDYCIFGKIISRARGHNLARITTANIWDFRGNHIKLIAISQIFN